jgi:hypothetical protein
MNPASTDRLFPGLVDFDTQCLSRSLLQRLARLQFAKIFQTEQQLA